MNPLSALGIAAAVIYWCLIDAAFFKIYLIVLLCFLALTQFSAPSRYNDFRRKVNAASWDWLNDPQILVTFQWNMHKADQYLEKKKNESGLPLTLTHFIGFCASRAIHNQPDFNGRLSFGNV